MAAYDYGNVLAAMAKGVNFDPFGNFAEGFGKGQQGAALQQKMEEALRVRNALQRAAQLAEGKNYPGAAGALMESGDAASGVRLLTDSDPNLATNREQFFQPIPLTDPVTGKTTWVQGSNRGRDFRTLGGADGMLPKGNLKTIRTPNGVWTYDASRPLGMQWSRPGTNQWHDQPPDAAQGVEQDGNNGAPQPTIPIDPGAVSQDQTVGKGEGERLLARPQAEQALRGSFIALNRLKASALELRDHEGLGKITGAWQWDPTGSIPASAVPSRPGTPQANADAKFATLKSEIITNVLQGIRENSKNGGALGNVSNYEDQILQDNVAALSQAQDLKSMKAALDQIAKYADSAKANLQQGFNDTYAPITGKMGGASSGDGGKAPPDLNAAPNGIDPKTWAHLTDDEKKQWYQSE